MARNAALDLVRRRRARPQPGLAEAVAEPASAAPLPDDDAEASDLRAGIEGALATLDEPYRSLLVLRDVEGLAYAEVADALDLPLNTMKVYLHRARRRFQTALAAASPRPRPMNRSDPYDGTGEPEPLPAPLAAELRALADAACPPDVVAAALAAARASAPPAPGRGGPGRPAPDRPAQRARSGRRWLPVALAALGAVVGAVVFWGGAEDAPPVQVAQVEPAPPTPGGGGAEPAPPAPASPTPPPQGGGQGEGLAGRPPAPAARRPAPGGVDLPPAPPRPEPGAPAPAVAAVAAPTEAEVEAAAADLRLAFALVADVQDRADRAFRDEAGALGSLDTALPHLAP